MVASTHRHACPKHVAKSYALLFRGEAYRHGCSAHGVHIQDVMVHSQLVNIVRPLEVCGASVRVLLAQDIHRGCANTSLHHRLASVFTERAVVAPITPAITQPVRCRASHPLCVASRRSLLHMKRSMHFVPSPQASIRAALSLFLAHAAQAESLILTRYDLLLLQPFQRWACTDERRIGIASQCEPLQWRQWNCTSDLLFVVPTAPALGLFEAFNASIGAETVAPAQYYPTRDPSAAAFEATPPQARWAKVTTDACFPPNRPQLHGRIANMRRSGHGCYNQLRARLGTASLSFCWTLPGTVTQRNAWYDCCRAPWHGLGYSAWRRFEH